MGSSPPEDPFIGQEDHPPFLVDGLEVVESIWVWMEKGGSKKDLEE